MRARVVSDDAYKLTRNMNALGKAARPIFREAGQRVAQQAADDLAKAARGFSRQSSALATSIDARRDRVPYVSVKPQGIYRLRGKRRRDAVRAGDVALGSEYGSRSRKTFVAPSHGGRVQLWKASGYWWRPTIKDNAPRWESIWLDYLDKILEKAGARL